jgi:proteasome accessory factor C
VIAAMPVKRIIQEMRLYFNAPIEYDRPHNGYRYAPGEGQAFELPGLWFSSTEIYALLTTQQLLAQVQPGLLDAQLKPVRACRIRKCFSRLSPLPFTGEG